MKIWLKQNVENLVTEIKKQNLGRILAKPQGKISGENFGMDLMESDC